MSDSNVIRPDFNKRQAERMFNAPDAKFDGPIVRTARTEVARKRRGKVAKAVLGGTVATGLLLGAGAVINSSNNKGREARANVAQDAKEHLNKGNEAWNSVVVLHEGANIRKAPIGGNDMVVDTVKDGEVWRIDRAVPSTDQYGRNWLVFKGSDKAGGQEGEFMVDLDGLRAQSTPDKPLIEQYDYSENAEAFQNGTATKESSLVGIQTDENGNQYALSPSGEHLAIGLTSAMPVEEFQRKAAEQGLVERING